jgi:hypothetical protein
MQVKQITTDKYTCDKCDKLFDVKDDCARHEESCDFDYLSNIITHDGKHTKKTDYLDEVEFHRMCVVQYKQHCWMGVNRQFTIGESDRKYYSNNNWSRTHEGANKLWLKQEDITTRRYFEFDETGQNDNVVYLTNQCLSKCTVKVTYANGDILMFDYDSPMVKYQEIVLFRDNRIVSIDIRDLEIEPESIPYETMGYTCETKCQYRDKVYVGSNGCKDLCQNFVGNRGDYSGSPIKCNYKTNHKNK